jgi:hypothetical protein
VPTISAATRTVVQKRRDLIGAVCRDRLFGNLLITILAFAGSRSLNAQLTSGWQAALGVGAETAHAERTLLGEIGRSVYTLARVRFDVVVGASRLGSGNLVCLADPDRPCDSRELANFTEFGVAASVPLLSAETTPYLKASAGRWSGRAAAVTDGRQSGEYGPMVAAEVGYRIRHLEVGVDAHQLKGSVLGTVDVISLVARALF